eukprot:47329-Chlamydomonas_euryale.AAC.1
MTVSSFSAQLAVPQRHHRGWRHVLCVRRAFGLILWHVHRPARAHAREACPGEFIPGQTMDAYCWLRWWHPV